MSLVVAGRLAKTGEGGRAEKDGGDRKRRMKSDECEADGSIRLFGLMIT